MLWWGAVLLAAARARQGDTAGDAGVVDQVFDGFGRLLVFVTWAILGLIVAHALWVVVLSVVLSTAIALGRGAGLAALMLFGGTALVIAALSVFDGFPWIALALITVALPTLGAVWATAPKQPAPDTVVAS